MSLPSKQLCAPFSDGISAFCLIAVLFAGCSNSIVPDEHTSEPAAAQKSKVEGSASGSVELLSAAPTLPGIVRWEAVPPLAHEVAIMETVFWEPSDTESLRALIFNTPAIKGSHVLEIGTGSGLVSLCCLQAGASQVVATDLNPKAVQNVRFNAAQYGDPHRLEARLVPRRRPDAWSVIQSDERFDFIISNPPWEDDKPKTVAEFALYDPDFVLLDSLVSGARERLRPNGRMWLAYGCVSAIRRIEMLAHKERLQFAQLDGRSLDELPEVFLPGMLLELTVPSTGHH